MPKPNFYDRLSTLEGLIAGGPAQADIGAFKALTAERTLYNYAFEHLSDPAWIAPLWDAGFFCTPPAIVADPTRGIISYPWWPETRFLARVAASAPELVADIIVALPETDNGRVHADLVDAANRMPVRFATVIATKEIAWVKTQDQLSFLLPKKLTELIGKLAAGDEPEVALTLLSILLDVFSPPRQRSIRHTEDTSLVAPEPRARISSWEYGNTLDATVPTLIAKRPRATLALLCALLRTVVSNSRAGGSSPPVDYSYIWRQSIDAEEDAHPDIKNRLVTAVRDAAQSVASASNDSLRFVLENLAQGSWHVFDRLALHLLAGVPDAEVPVIRRYLCDIKYLDHPHFEEEYRLALRTHFGRLDSEDKDEILGWIARGPDVDAWKSLYREWTKKVATSDDEREYVDRWQLSHLEPISVFLANSWRDRWSELTAKYGAPASRGETARAARYYETLATPKTSEELATLSVPALVEFLKNWRPSEGEKGTVHGLAGALRQAISMKPEKYWDEALVFRAVPILYIRVLVDSWKTAIRAGTSVQWSQVFELCEYVLENKEGEAGNTKEEVEVLKSTDQTIAELLSSGLESGNMPDSERARVWSLLRELAEAEDPTPESEQKSNVSGIDAATMSLNATRPVALHGVVRYALWVRRSIEKTADQAARLASGFDEMPEVRQLLEQHLDQIHEPSIAVRAVYGQWFPWLTLLDTQWTARVAESIFPAAEEDMRLWHAAWSTYITFCRPYDNVFDILGSQYALAASRIDEAESVSPNSLDAKLAEHLMVLYWRGKIGSPVDETALGEFYRRAPSALATHALAFVGQSLTDPKESIPASILGRLQHLWELRASTAQAAPSIAPFRSELASFGWWFGSGQFPVQWATRELIRVLHLVGTIQADYQVVRRLPVIAAEHPLEAVEALRLLFETDKEDLSDGWELYPRSVLEAALRSQDPKVQELVDETIDHLGARGHLEFRDLVSRR